MKDLIMALAGPKKPADDKEPADEAEGGDDQGRVAAAEEIIEAIQSGDAKALADALNAFMGMGD